MSINKIENIGQATLKEKHANNARRLMRVLKIRPWDLYNKKVLDVGTGEGSLAASFKSHKLPATIISYDIDPKEFDQSIRGSAVAGDLEDGLPFQDNQFDYIFNVGGPLRGGPWNPVVIDNYQEAIRTLKPGGQIRIYNPFMGYGGMAHLIYMQNRDGNIDVTKIDFDQYFDGKHVQYDPNGYPIPLPPGDDFWIGEYMNWKKHSQEDYSRFIATELETTLNQANDVKLELVDTDSSSSHYDPTLFITKNS